MAPMAPTTTADGLLRDTLAALDTCLTTLMQIDERARGLAHETEAAHREMRQHLHDFGVASPPTGPLMQTPARPTPGPFAVDHEAIYRDELAFQQTMASLRSLATKVDYATNLIRSGKAHLLGSDPNGLSAAPWSGAVRAARIAAQEDERMRLAREVHDGPAQVLANAILGLEYCEVVAKRAPAELDYELVRLRSTLREGLSEVRRFMFDLRPTMLASLGLNATLRHYAHEFERVFGIAVHLDLPAQELAIDDSAQIVLFRVAQESLQNVQKHAGASSVRLAVGRLPDAQVELRIDDNGQGFERHQLQPGIQSGAGLLGMEERARLLGGHLTVESLPGRGTTIILRLPEPAMDRDAEAALELSTHRTMRAITIAARSVS